MKLTDKIAIVTGGAHGIGLAIVERFLAEGANVIVADIDKKAGEEVQKRLRKNGTVKFIHCDVGQKLDIHNLVAETLDEFDRIDILVNNAGTIATADFLDLEEEDFDNVLKINLKGAFLCGQAVARQMAEQVKLGGDPGTIINLSSVNARVAIANQTAYCVSKGGVSQLTKAMALALAELGIRVNAIGPGSIMTNILESAASDAQTRRNILSRTPLGRIGDPEEIATIAAFLASDDASYITGQTIYADGGRLALNHIIPVNE